MSVAREKRIQMAMAEALKRLADLEAENIRLADLVRFARVHLHQHELISEEEYAALVSDNGPERVARLCSYDRMRAEISRLQEKIEQLELLESRSAAEAERIRKQWGDRNPEFLEAIESSAAGATDLMNQWARQSYVQEAEDERGLHTLAKRLWDAAMDEVERERKRAEFWKAECEKRASMIATLYREDCTPLIGIDRLMDMPEEPKP